MGSLYWQVNDSYPVVSWSSIDCFNRRKALHYAAARFYLPVLISADDRNAEQIRLNISSERTEKFKAEIVWHSRKNTGEIISGGRLPVTVEPLSSNYFLTLTLAETGISHSERNAAYIEFSLLENGSIISSNTYMLLRLKKFDFIDPKLSFSVKENVRQFEITVKAAAFAKGVWLDLKNSDCVFTDNFFDLHGGEKTVTVEKTSVAPMISPGKFAEELIATSYYEALIKQSK